MRDMPDGSCERCWPSFKKISEKSRKRMLQYCQLEIKSINRRFMPYSYAIMTVMKRYASQ